MCIINVSFPIFAIVLVLNLCKVLNTYYLDGAAYCKEGGVVKEINLQVMRNIKVGLPSFLFLARNQNLA